MRPVSWWCGSWRLLQVERCRTSWPPENWEFCDILRGHRPHMTLIRLRILDFPKAMRVMRVMTVKWPGYSKSNSKKWSFDLCLSLPVSACPCTLWTWKIWCFLIILYNFLPYFTMFYPTLPREISFIFFFTAVFRSQFRGTRGDTSTTTFWSNGAGHGEIGSTSNQPSPAPLWTASSQTPGVRKHLCFRNDINNFKYVTI